jgi:hypothetical protein
MWQRVLIWGVIVFVAFNVLSLVFVLAGNLLSSGLVRFVITVAIFLAVAVPFGGLNLLHTWGNKATAEFNRSDDPAKGGYLYRVRPARASWLAVLVPLPLCALVALWGVYASWVAYAAMTLYFVVAGVFVLPGARHRKPVTISVSPHGIHGEDVAVPIDQIAELEVRYGGVKVSEDPLMPGRNGVSTSAMVGRGLGYRQAARSFMLTLRGDGESDAHVLAGGLTLPCAENLQRDIENAVAKFRSAASTAV